MKVLLVWLLLLGGVSASNGAFNQQAKLQQDGDGSMLENKAQFKEDSTGRKLEMEQEQGFEHVFHNWSKLLSDLWKQFKEPLPVRSCGAP
jgi:hypothetical protein